MPKLTETFDQLKMSSKIRSTDRFLIVCVFKATVKSKLEVKANILKLNLY